MRGGFGCVFCERGGSCHVSFLQEEGVQYDLEYAFVLGDDLDTAEMRVANSLWRSTREACGLPFFT